MHHCNVLGLVGAIDKHQNLTRLRLATFGGPCLSQFVFNLEEVERASWGSFEDALHLFTGVGAVVANQPFTPSRPFMIDPWAQAATPKSCPRPALGQLQLG